MAVPNIAATGRFQGPYQYIHLNDTSSHAVGGASSTADIWVGNTSTLTVGGVIGSLIMATANTAGSVTFTIDGNTSSQPIFDATQKGAIPLNIGFSTGFVVSNSSTTGHAVVTYVLETP